MILHTYHVLSQATMPAGLHTPITPGSVYVAFMLKINITCEFSVFALQWSEIRAFYSSRRCWENKLMLDFVHMNIESDNGWLIHEDRG